MKQFKNHVQFLARKLKIKFLALGVSKETRWRIAVHEAGHAFLMLKAKLPQVETWIEGEGGWAKSGTYFLSNWDALGHMEALKIKMAGLAAEQLFFQKFDYTASSFDRQNALDVVKSHPHLHGIWKSLILVSPGKNSVVVWETMADMTSIEQPLLQAILSSTYQELKENKEAIDNIAKDLFERGYLHEKDMHQHLQQSN